MTVARLALTFALLGSTACWTKIDGELFIDPASYRKIEFVPISCVDGDDFGFFGVQIRDEEDRILDFFRNGDEPGLALYVPGKEAVELGPADCTTLVGSLDRELDETANEGRVDGSFEADCEAPNGWTLYGKLSFQRCDAPEDDDYDYGDDDDDDDGPSSGS